MALWTLGYLHLAWASESAGMLLLLLLAFVFPAVCLLIMIFRDASKDDPGAYTDSAGFEGASEVPRAPGAFSSGLCECHTDCCSTWTVICCTPMALGQLVHRLLVPKRQKKAACLVLAAVMWGVMLWVLYAGLWGPRNEVGLSTSPSDDETTDDEDAAFILNLFGVLGLLAAVLICFIRKRVRERDQIPPTCGVEWVDDFFQSYFCGCCVLSQLMRHEGLDGSRYRLCSPDGATLV